MTSPGQGVMTEQTVGGGLHRSDRHQSLQRRTKQFGIGVGRQRVFKSLALTDGGQRVHQQRLEDEVKRPSKILIRG